MPTNLIQIVVGEFEFGNRSNMLHMDLVASLMQKDFSGITLIRSDEGIGEGNDIRRLSIESVPLNNLPIIIEALEEASLKETSLKETLHDLKNQLPHGEITTIPAYQPFKEELLVDDDDFLLLKIFINEKIQWFGFSLHEKIILLLKDHHLIWSTVKQGIAGYGSDKIVRRKSFFSLSSPCPLVIESIGKAEQIKKVIPELKKMIKEGMVIAIPVNVVFCQ